DAKPGVSNLLTIQSAFTGRSVDDIVADYQRAGAQYGALKTDTADALEAFVTPLRERFDQYMSDRGELERILADGADRARAVAGPVLSQVYSAVGFTAPRRHGTPRGGGAWRPGEQLTARRQFERRGDEP